MKVITIFLILIHCVAFPVLAAGETLSKLEARINSEGARAVLSDIWNSPEFGDVLDSVASGDERWLEVGLALREESDAGVTTMLRESFALALISAPARILQYQENGKLGFSVEELCGSAFIDEPAMGYNAYFNAIEKSILAIRSSSLVETKEGCLKALNEGRKSYSNWKALNEEREAY
ncbi:hypothetical protein ACJO5Y_18235 [Marinobacter sp. GN3S48]|uniref:hypothetical protein n=1 Tax=Marinobacter sp. GN3S48 TaxID=3382302 RepID=UPI00387AB4AE